MAKLRMTIYWAAVCIFGGATACATAPAAGPSPLYDRLGGRPATGSDAL